MTDPRKKLRRRARGDIARLAIPFKHPQLPPWFQMANHKHGYQLSGKVGGKSIKPLVFACLEDLIEAAWYFKVTGWRQAPKNITGREFKWLVHFFCLSKGRRKNRQPQRDVQLALRTTFPQVTRWMRGDLEPSTVPWGCAELLRRMLIENIEDGDEDDLAWIPTSR